MKPLKILLTIHAVITFLAGLALIIFPELIPKSVDVYISKNQYLLCYFLAACEISIAYLSFQATKIQDTKALKIILNSFIIFHLATAILEVYSLKFGVSVMIVFNIILRFVISTIFLMMKFKFLQKNSRL